MMAERLPYGLSGAIPGRSGLGAVVVERMAPGFGRRGQWTGAGPGSLLVKGDHYLRLNREDSGSARTGRVAASAVGADRLACRVSSLVPGPCLCLAAPFLQPPVPVKHLFHRLARRVAAGTPDAPDGVHGLGAALLPGHHAEPADSLEAG